MRLGISALVIAALATAGLTGCGDSTDGTGGAGGGAGTGGTSNVGSGGAGGTGAGTGGDAGTGGEAPGCTIEVVADAAQCEAGCDLPFSNDDGTANLCTIDCTSDADCDTANTDEVCDGALGQCIFSCGAGAPGCPTGFICDDATTGAGTLLCIPDQLSE